MNTKPEHQVEYFVSWFLLILCGTLTSGSEGNNSIQTVKFPGEMATLRDLS